MARLGDTQVQWGGQFTLPEMRLPQVQVVPPQQQYAPQSGDVQVVQPEQYVEPLIRPGNIAAAVLGAFLPSYRTPLWLATVGDVVARRMSAQYRYSSYQYFHRFFNF